VDGNVSLLLHAAMKLDELLQIKQQLFAIADQLTESKGRGYGTDSDTLKNIRLSEYLEVAPSEIGVYIRTLDKVMRLGRILTTSEEAVGHEGLLDTVVDTINYLTYIVAIRVEKDDKLRSVFLNSQTTKV
jgi:hypothetical protein